MRGLLAIEPLYHQIVAGKKTQTRRSGGLEQVNLELDFLGEKEHPDNWVATEIPVNDKFQVIGQYFCRKGTVLNRGGEIYCKPRYKVGEVLYLKEPYREPVPGTYWYKFTMYPNNKVNIYDWKNRLFMPSSAARAFIRITGIKCERLLDISDEDCIAEGIEYFEIITDKKEKTGYKNYFYDAWFWHPKDSFISLYKLANKMKPKAEITNIWVWAYQFEYLPDYKL